MLDFEEAKDKVIMGVERKSMVLSDDEKQKTAYHEAGHAICNLYCKEADPLHKVTIIPRGARSGSRFRSPEKTGTVIPRNIFSTVSASPWAEGVAEEIIFNLSTTGAANDIKQATEMVRKLICDYGMSTELGPLTYGEKRRSGIFRKGL